MHIYYGGPWITLRDSTCRHGNSIQSKEAASFRVLLPKRGGKVLKRSFVTILTATCLIIAGCATTPQKQIRTDAFDAGSGFGIVRVVTNTATLDRGNIVHFNQWNEVKVIDKNGDLFELKSDSQGGESNSQIFIGQLPEGSYRLHSLHTRFVSGIALPLQDLNESFEVKPARLTALGTIVVQPTGNHQFTKLRDFGIESLVRYFNDAFPSLSRTARRDEVLQSSVSDTVAPERVAKGGVIVESNSATMAITGTLTIAVIQHLIDKASATEIIEAWRREKDPLKRFGMARDSTYGFNSPLMLASGELLAGSGLGQVLKRSLDGKWSRLDTGALHEITALAAPSPEHIIAGGEEGFVAETTDGARSWRHLPLLPVNCVVLNLLRLPDATLALVLEGYDAVLYSLGNAAGERWTELKREAGARTNPATPAIMAAGAAQVGENYVIVTGNSAMHIMDLKTRRWSSAKTPFVPVGLSKPNTLRARADGTVFALGFRSSYSTSDLGATWQKRDNSCLRLLDAWRGPGESAYNLCADGVFAVSTAIAFQPEAKGQWREVPTPTLASSWFVSDDGALLILAGTEGLLHSSRDGGKTWALERTPLN